MNALKCLHLVLTSEVHNSAIFWDLATTMDHPIRIEHTTRNYALLDHLITINTMKSIFDFKKK